MLSVTRLRSSTLGDRKFRGYLTTQGIWCADAQEQIEGGANVNEGVDKWDYESNILPKPNYFDLLSESEDHFVKVHH